MQTLICTFSSLIQTILSVPESHRFGCKKQFTDYTVGREYASSAAPCPEEFLLYFSPLLYSHCPKNVNTGWTFSHSFANIISMKISNILRTDKTLDFSFLYHRLGVSYSRTRARTLHGKAVISCGYSLRMAVSCTI